MNTLVHADIFFFVTTIVVVVVAAAFTVALVYLIKILRDVREISKEVREEVVLFREDVQVLRTGIRNEGLKFGTIATLVADFVKRKITRSKTKKQK